MEKITIYKAFDGITFDNEDDCILYERKKKCKYTFLDCHFEPTENIDDVWYMILRNEDDLDYVEKEGYAVSDHEQCREFRLDYLYYYDEEDQGFRSFDSKIREMKHRLNDLEKLEMRCATAMMKAEKEKEV